MEALANAPVFEIVNDFMLTFKNYYNVIKGINLKRYNKIAEITIYRLIYSLLVKNPLQELTKINNWFDFNAKEEVLKIIGDGNKPISEYVEYYLTNLLSISPEVVSI